MAAAADLEVKISNEQYLGIFLQPPSITEYKQRLVTWLTESEEDIALRMELAEVQQAAASDDKVGTAVLLVDREGWVDSRTWLGLHYHKDRTLVSCQAQYQIKYVLIFHK